MHLASQPLLSSVPIWKIPGHLSSLGKCTKRLQSGLQSSELHERQKAQHAASYSISSGYNVTDFDGLVHQSNNPGASKFITPKLALAFEASPKHCERAAQSS